MASTEEARVLSKATSTESEPHITPINGKGDNSNNAWTEVTKPKKRKQHTIRKERPEQELANKRKNDLIAAENALAFELRDPAHDGGKRRNAYKLRGSWRVDGACTSCSAKNALESHARGCGVCSGQGYNGVRKADESGDDDETLPEGLKIY